MSHMLQADQPDDFVLATNETNTIKEFVEKASHHVGLGWRKYVKYYARYKRPAEVDLLVDGPAKTKNQLGWEPKLCFAELVQIMFNADLASLQGTPVVDSLTPACANRCRVPFLLKLSSNTFHLIPPLLTTRLPLNSYPQEAG
jgi:hypothetical protein